MPKSEGGKNTVVLLRSSRGMYSYPCCWRFDFDVDVWWFILAGARCRLNDFLG
jgi:hypothetical protein